MPAAAAEGGKEGEGVSWRSSFGLAECSARCLPTA